jgi:hypothetical protein
MNSLSEYYQLLAHELVAGLSANSRIIEITRNPTILGAYAEATVKEFVERVVAPYRISTGTVVSPALLRGGMELPQIDLMVWSPSPLPAIFQSGEFAIVPHQSCLGVMEIKRSNYTGAGADISRLIGSAPELVKGVPPELDGGEVLVRTPKGEPQTVSGQIQAKTRDQGPRALGVVCVREHGRRDLELERLVEREEACILLNKVGETVEPNLGGVLVLVNFLMAVRKRGRDSDGERRLDIEYIKRN